MARVRKVHLYCENLLLCYHGVFKFCISKVKTNVLKWLKELTEVLARGKKNGV